MVFSSSQTSNTSTIKLDTEKEEEEIIQPQAKNNSKPTLRRVRDIKRKKDNIMKLENDSTDEEIENDHVENEDEQEDDTKNGETSEEDEKNVSFSTISESKASSSKAWSSKASSSKAWSSKASSSKASSSKASPSKA